MPNEATLELMEKARVERDRAEEKAGADSASIKQALRELEQAAREANAQAMAAAEARINQLSTRRDEALTQFRNATEKLHGLRRESEAIPAEPLNVPSEVPLVLFPVRLETRFKTDAGQTTLLIRVYPDDIHVDAHERQLTQNELARAKQYWDEVWRGGKGESGLQIERAAWNRLCNEFGVERAAWMVRLLEPSNLANRPAAAIPSNVSLPATPVFKKVELQESAWTRAPRTMVLPDRWIAICYGPDERLVKVGETIPDVLNVGPKPDASSEQPADAKPEDLLSMLDPDMKWLVDFATAKTVGMALEVSLPESMAGGLTGVVVLGVKESMKAEAAAETLSKLLDAHHYTHGLALVPPGTPTNNTSEGRSGLQTRDPGHERSFEIERRRELESEADGQILAEYLGMHNTDFSAVFAGITDADRKHLDAARTMNTALWSATLGYFLDKRLTLLTPDQLLLVKKHFVEHVRSAGPLPTLRVGKQPYGLLPVVSLDQWTPAAGEDARAALALRGAREFFRRTVVRGNVPTLRDHDSIDWNLMRVLQMSPVSIGFNSRNVLGPVLTDNFWSFAGSDLDTKWWDAQKELMLSLPGLPLLNPQSTSVFGTHVDEVKPPLVKPDGNETLEPDNYIAILARASHQQLRDNIALPSTPPPLLYSLLRHALLREYGDTAFRILLSQNLVTEGQRAEPELIDIDPEVQTLTVWRQLETTVPAITGDKTLGQFLDDPQNSDHPQVQPLTELRAAVMQLAQEPVSELERLIPETLDLASHRLDAWITSLATKRLKAMRAANATGVMLGGYGWVEDLKPAAAADRASDGFMHLPSLTHATTAAILASGYSSHKTGPAGTNLFAMNLSSERIRVALSLIEGVRQGQPLAALIGYRIERALYDDRRLARFVATFRRLAPLTGGPEPPTGPIDAVAANNVVHGLRILRLWKGRHHRFEQLRAADPTLFTLIDEIFRKAEDAVDAVSDLLVADSVHQTSCGNFQRAGLTVEAIARGQAVPEPEIIKTPRTGTVLTHRVVAIFDPRATMPENWPGNSPRAKTEPSLNTWLGKLFGDPENVRIRCEYIDPATREVLPGPEAAREVQLSKLGLSPLDIVAFASSKAGERGDLERWIEQHLRSTRPPGIPSDALVRLNRERDSTWPSTIASLDEFLVGVRAAARLLGGVRALEANNLTLPSDPRANTTDSNQLRIRANELIKAFGNAKTALDTLLTSNTSIEQLTQALLDLARFNLPGAIPDAPASDSDQQAALTKLAATNLRVAEERLRKVVQSETEFERNDATVEEQVKHDVERIKTILGAGFAVVTQFRMANRHELRLSFDSSSTLLAGNLIEAETWFLRVSRVRDRLNQLSDLRQCGELIANNRLSLTVAQLPFQENDRWIGLPLQNNNARGGRLSLVTVGALPDSFDQLLTGIVIDEWTEIIPADRETTGITFHYDQPGARPPHCVLLAVPPGLGTPWNLDALERVVLETLELAKLRMVDQRGLQELSSYLPGLYFPINAAGDTVSTDLRTGMLLGDPN